MYSVGVVVGRFQVDKLHDAHRNLLNHVYHNSDRTLVLIGVPAIQGTFNNPLDYQTRAAMVQEFFGADPEVTIMPIHDRESDLDWSEKLDSVVGMLFPDAKEVDLYHARDGFGDHYHGRHSCVDLTDTLAKLECSGTEVREICGSFPLGTEDFRHGVIYGSQHVWPHVKMAVDIVMFRNLAVIVGAHGRAATCEVLLGRKRNEETWRLPGGMVDPDDLSLEFAAARELFEETGMTVEGSLDYLISGPVADWRYGGLPNEGLFTSAFATPYTFGRPVAGDDLVEVDFVPISVALSVIRTEHRPILDAFIQKYITG